MPQKNQSEASLTLREVVRRKPHKTLMRVSLIAIFQENVEAGFLLHNIKQGEKLFKDAVISNVILVQKLVRIRQKIINIVSKQVKDFPNCKTNK